MDTTTLTGIGIPVLLILVAGALVWVTTQICKEAISNAVRHGDAKNAKITIDRELDDILELEVSNDGTPRPNEIKQGLGTGMIEDLSLSWSLASENNRTRLSVQIPLQTK